MSHVGPVCKHKSCDKHPRYGYLCAEHAKEDLGLEIKDSLIPKAGKGLFTTVDIAKGTIIDKYNGKIIKIADAPANNLYLLQINKTDAVDASNIHSCFSRFANSARSKDLPLRNNCILRATRTGDKIPNLVAKQNIKAGAELLVSYSKSYWQDIDKEARDTKKAIADVQAHISKSKMMLKSGLKKAN